MPFTFLNGTIETSGASAASVSIDTKMVTGIHCLLDYTKGNESSLDINFATNNEDASVSASYYDLVERTVTTGATVSFKYTVSATGKYSLPAASPDASDKMKVTFTLQGGTTGAVSVFLARDNKYE